MRWKQSAAVLLTAGALSGCTTVDDEFGFSGRYGPAPVLVAETVRASVVNQDLVIRAVSAGPDVIARFPAIEDDRLLPVLPAYGAREAWFHVITRGFNTIDDACEKYVTDLWILERRKTRNSTIIHGAGLLGAARQTPSTVGAMVALTHAFGLAGVLNNAFADSYLYSQSASSVRQLVKTTRDAYRNDLAKNFLVDRSLGLPPEVAYPMASVPAAYHHMREYLSLCLPPSIQNQIEVLVAKAKSGPVGSSEERRVADEKAAGAARTAPVTRRATPRTGPQLTVF